MAVEAFEEGCADAPVAVLAGHDAAEGLGEVGRGDGDGLHALAVAIVVDVQKRAGVEDADAGVGVEGGA